MGMKLSAKEIVEQLTDDIENHPDRYPTWNSVFDKLFHSVHENYPIESDMKYIHMVLTIRDSRINS